MAVPNKEDEQDFKQMWTEAQNRFEKTTKKSLGQGNTRNLDDVLKDLDKRFNADDPEDGGTKRRIQQLASNVLTFIDLLGGIAAQGASMVFGPANLCFNAMQFLIDIPAKVSKFHEGLALLFEEISTFMKQFRVYRRIEQFTKIDVELKQCTHQLMIVFVDICRLSIEVVSGSKLKKMWTVAKIALFEDDSGVQEKLKEFKMLISHQSQIADAVTLEHVLKTEHMVPEMKKALERNTQQLEASLLKTDFVVKYVNASNSQKDQHDQTDRICKKLSNTPDSVQNMVQRLERVSDQIGHETLSGTGSWLKDNNLYKRWTDLGSEDDSLLCLSGNPGSGKSYLAFHVLESFRDRYSNADSNSVRVALACYRFVTNDQLPLDEAIKHSLKCMAAQIAKQDVVYSKNLDSRLKSKDVSIFKDMVVKDLAEELLLTSKTKDTTDTAYVLLFDGVDQLSDDEASQLLAATVAMKSSKVRVVITGTEKPLEKLLGSTPTIRVAEHNEADIKRFIDSELKASKVLQREVPEISGIVGTIRSKLPDIANGSFNGVRQIIETVSISIESGYSEEQIMELISSETLNNEGGASKRIVDELNRSLHSQEIEQLNELLSWTIYALRYISVDEMQALSFMRTKKRPLQSLEDKVAQKYSGLLNIDPNDNCFKMKNAELEAFFTDSNRDTKDLTREGDDDPKISMEIKIDHVNVSKAQRFFWDLSEKVVLEKFSFAKSLTENKRIVKISANPTEAHLALTRRCFDLLEESSEESKTLGQYAATNLPMHLSFLRERLDDDPLSTGEKEMIVDHLVSLLQFVDCIESHLTDFFFAFRRWLDEDEVEAIHDWLCDPSATSSLNPKGRSWLTQVTSGGRLLPLSNVAKMVARQWLCYRTWSAELPFLWIDAFLDQVEREEAPRQEAGGLQSGSDKEDTSEQEGSRAANIDNPDNGAIPIRNRVLRAVKWAENEAKITKTSLLYERLGNTYSRFTETDLLNEENDLSKAEIELAKEEYSTAKRYPDCSWEVSEGLANVLARSGEKNLAVREMELVFHHLREQEGPTPNEKARLVKDLIMSARWQTDLNNTDDSVDKLREAIRVDEHHYRGYYELLKVFVATEQESEALHLLDEMRTQTAKDDSFKRLEAMFLEFLDWEDHSVVYFETVFNATRNSNMFEVVLQTLQSALTSARESNTISRMIQLLLSYGVAHAYYSAGGQCLADALTHWTECYELGSRCESWMDWSSVLTAMHCVLNFHYSKANSPQDPFSDFETHLAKLTKLIDGVSNDYVAKDSFRLLLGGFYNLIGKQDQVQKLLLNDMKTAIDLLSDDDPANDYIGYERMVYLFCHTADDLNALSAWSLFGSSLSYQTTAFSFSCDGRCNIPITFEKPIWFCKVCSDIQFHDECLEKLRKGTLKRYVCSPDHQWLRMPSSVDELQATGKGRVRVEGELQDGKRIGGRIVAVDEWLNMIREKWGIENPTSVVHVEDEKQEED